MSRKIVVPFFLLLLVAVAGCFDEDEPSSLGPDPALDRGGELARDRSGSGALSVLTWNVYYGADLDVLLSDGDTPLPARVAAVFGQVQATDAPTRAAAIADRIADVRPHLVGLQEVAHYRTQAEGDFLDGSGAVRNPTPNATETVFDFVDLLLAALADLGLSYEQASRTTTFDVELPMFTGGPCPPCSDLRLTESVAILARSDLETSGASGDRYDVNLQVSVGGFDIEIPKGWASVDATIRSGTYRFVTTHLEPADVGPGGSVVPQIHEIQLAQAAELLDELDAARTPLVLTGDLNSDPHGSTTDTYGVMADAGFVDTWLVGRPRGDGYTANHDADLLNAESALFHRVDYVLYRDDFTAAGGPYRGAVHAERLGEEQDDRTAGGLWPSDHAGVLATLRTSQEPRGGSPGAGGRH